MKRSKPASRRPKQVQHAKRRKKTKSVAKAFVYISVLEGLTRIPGKYERLAYERQERDLKLAARPEGHPKGFYFDPAAGQRVITFIERFCRHHKGEWAGQQFQLCAWQKFCIMVTYGWKRHDGTRRFRISYREVARKNGKTEQAAAEATYLEIADGEEGAEVYSTATKEDQAKIVWQAADEMVKRSPELSRWILRRNKALICERMTATFKPLGSDSETQDGLNPHGHICDEMHAHKKRGMWDVMITGQAARRQPLNIVITTAGIFDPESIGWELHQHAQQVLDGVIDDDTFFAIIYAGDAEEGTKGMKGYKPADNWQHPVTWWKANPNLGISVKEEYLVAQCKSAQTQPSFLNTFLRLHCDQWTQQLTRWIPMELWNACDDMVDQTLERYRGRVAYLGLDLSTKLDICAETICIPPDVEGLPYDFIWRFWVPEGTVRKRVQKAQVPDYTPWIRDGWLTMVPGDVIDYDFIKKEILLQRTIVNIRQVGYDPWNATQFAQQLGFEGFSSDEHVEQEQLVELRQGMKTMSEPCKEFEKLIVSQQLRHGGNPVMKWMIDNVVVRRDANDNIAPDKKSASGKIDGVVTAIMALSRAILSPLPPPSIYESRGILELVP